MDWNGRGGMHQAEEEGEGGEGGEVEEEGGGEEEPFNSLTGWLAE